MIRYLCLLAAERSQMRAMRRALRALTPEFECGPDFLLVDWRGLERLHGPAEQALPEFAAVAAHMGGARRAAAAVLAARAAAHFQRPWVLLPAGEEAAILSPWPVMLLGEVAGGHPQRRSGRAEANGVPSSAWSQAGRAARTGAPNAQRRALGWEPRRGPRQSLEAALAVLAAWGIRALGQLAALPAAALHARLGQTGLRLRALARGEGGTEALALVPRRARGVIWRRGFEPALEDLAAIERVVERQLARLAAWLDHRDRMAEALELRLELTHAASRCYRARFTPPIRQARMMAGQLALALRRDPPPAAVMSLCLRARLTVARPLQPSLFVDQESTAPRPETTAKLMQKLTARLGPGGGLGSPRLVDNHRPGAFRLEPFAYPEAAGRGGEVEGAGDGVPPRRPPQSVGSAEFPQSTGQASACPPLRALRPPQAARVRLDAAGQPVAAAVGAMPMRPLARCSGPWRSSGEWWTATAWDWEHWDVEIARRRLRLRQDRRGGGWVCDGTYD